MSFPNNGIWMPNGSGSLGNGEMGGVSTRNEQKRGPQWLMDTSEQELFFSKKQAIESVNNGATSGAAIMSYSLWRDTSGPQSGGHVGDRLFSPKPVRSSIISDNNVSVVPADLNMAKKGFENQIGIDSSTRLSMSQTADDPLCLNSGIRKVKVNEVRVLENRLPEFVGNSYPGEKNKEICTTFQTSGNTVLLGPTYNTADVNAISVDPALSDMDKNGQICSKTDGNLMLNHQYFSGIDNNMLSVGQAFNSSNCNTVSIGEHYEKNHGHFMSICPTYRSAENFFIVDPFYNKSNETFNMLASSAYKNGHTDIASLTSVHGQQDAAAVASLRTVYNEENSMMLSLGENYEKGDQTTISFGSFQDNPEDNDNSNRLVCSRDILLGQSSAQSSGLLGQKDSVEQLNAKINSVVTSRTDGAPKEKEQKTKKGSSNNFPANVKSLLSTGILDGIPVKYVSWSREKNLRGVVKGTGYLCSCQDCKLSKAVNAYEFERHAGCKTKHPNNHIYFENGKTIYAVVQELKSTPQELLFEAIQNVTGSPVHQKNFHTWKASYQAATRELQRIYGKDEKPVPS